MRMTGVALAGMLLVLLPSPSDAARPPRTSLSPLYPTSASDEAAAPGAMLADPWSALAPQGESASATRSPCGTVFSSRAVSS